MSIRIPPIIEGHDGGACFWIQPVKCHSKKCFDWDAVEECEAAEISLDEEDVFGFLKYFFIKYFDENLIYNRQRRADWCGVERKCEPAEFVWYLTHNFYTYKSFRQMLADISSIADQLESMGIHAIPLEITKDYSAWLIDEDIHQKMNVEENLQFMNEHISVVIGFYRRFVCRMVQMLDENPEWPLISIMGP